MAVQGIFASNQSIVGDRVGDFASSMLKLYPTGTAPLLMLSSGMKKAGTQDTVFTFYEDSHASGRTNIVSGGTTTTLVVGDGSFYVPGTVLMVEETGEFLYVLANTNGNTLTVTRGMAGTTVVSVTSSMNVYAVGNAREEASAMPTAVTQQGHPRTNYTQIFRNGWAISGTAKAIKYLTGNKLAKNKADCAMYHAEDMEKAFLWGKKHIGIVNNKQFRMTDGIVTQIEQYGGTVVSAASGGTPGNLSLADFQEFMRSVFKKQIKGEPNERIAFGGDQIVSVINRATQLDGVLQYQAGETKTGIAVWKVISPWGTLNLMTHPLMVESPFWAKQMYAIHPAGITKRVLRDTFPDEHDASGKRINGKDADEGALTSEMGFEVGGAATMGILRNVTQAVKSN